MPVVEYSTGACLHIMGARVNDVFLVEDRTDRGYSGLMMSTSDKALLVDSQNRHGRLHLQRRGRRVDHLTLIELITREQVNEFRLSNRRAMEADPEGRGRLLATFDANFKDFQRRLLSLTATSSR